MRNLVVVLSLVALAAGSPVFAGEILKCDLKYVLDGEAASRETKGLYKAEKEIKDEAALIETDKKRTFSYVAEWKKGELRITFAGGLANSEARTKGKNLSLQVDVVGLESWIFGETGGNKRLKTVIATCSLD